MSLICVSDHENIFGNEKANELVKSGASLDKSEAEIIPCSLGTIKRELKPQFQQIAQNRWISVTKCKIAKQICAKYDKAKTKDILHMYSIYRLSATITVENMS